MNPEKKPLTVEEQNPDLILERMVSSEEWREERMKALMGAYVFFRERPKLRKKVIGALKEKLKGESHG